MAKKKQPTWRIGEKGRKVGKTKLAKLNEMLGAATTATERTFLRREAKVIHKAMEMTYPSKGYTEKQVKQATNILESLRVTNTLFGGEKAVKNYMYQHQINLSTKHYKDESGKLQALNVTPMTEAETKIFYQATQEIWIGKSGNRNAIIMKHFGVNDLQEVFELVLSHPNTQLALATAKREINPNTELTEEQQELYDAYEESLTEDSEQHRQGSPDYLDYVVKFDVNEKWANGKPVETDK